MKLHEIKRERSVLSLLGVLPVTLNDSLIISDQSLTSLKGCPETVENFYCNNNNLTSLKYGPIKVIGDYVCNNNRLTSLEGVAKEIDYELDCSENALTTLKGCPEIIGGDFVCSDNKLTSLIGGPKIVKGEFWCNGNKITSIEGAPSGSSGQFIMYDNKLTSLKDIHKYVKSINGEADFSRNPIKSHVLGLLKIKGLVKVELNIRNVEKIINKYLPEGNIFDCQEELIEAGYEEFAQL